MTPLRALLFALFVAITLAHASALAAGGPPTPNDGGQFGPPAPSDSIQIGVASYYADTFEGRATANGERFIQGECTAPHPWLPFGTVLRVINPMNDREVLVRVNDRGPFLKGRILDLSRSAAEAIDMIRQGTATVRIELLRRGGR